MFSLITQYSVTSVLYKPGGCFMNSLICTECRSMAYYSPIGQFYVPRWDI